MRTKIARVFISTDMHIRDTDFKSIVGYRKAIRQVIRDQIDFCKEMGVTHTLLTGDISDKGYKSISQSYSDENLFREWKSVVNGNLYSTIGNHLFLEMDSNPELFWIQPNNFIRPRDPEYTPPEEPLIKVVDYIMIGKVQFSFHHYSKTDKEYIVPRHPDAVHHHAIYHDDCVIPSNIQEDYHLGRRISSEYLKRIFENVDSATVGHIHANYGLVSMHVDGKEIPMDIPGSNCITQIKEREMHETVKLPIYDIYDDGTMEKWYQEFSLHFEMMTFRKREIGLPKEFQEIAKGTLETAASPQEILFKTTSEYVSPEKYLLKLGYTEDTLEMYTIAKAEPLSADRVLNIMFNLGDEENGSS